MRPDLAALTPDTIAALSNWGLVKRASREEPPRLEERPDGTVTGSFADGTLATLPPGKSLAEGSCTCGATTVCRHRVATALAYPRGEAPEDPWSPAEVSDEELERFLGKRTLEKARATLARGLRAEVEGDSVRLPTCTVRFLVPRELAMARCNCTQKGACEHVALAVWCFRKRGKSPLVEFGAARERKGERLELPELLLRRGIVDAGDLAGAFARARQDLQGMTWPLCLVQTLEEQLAFYREGSSRYRASEVAFALLSLQARLQGVKELSASYVLGQDTPPETELEHVRLISLGCRLRGGVPCLYLADPAGQVLVLEKPSRLATLAKGQLISQGVRRRANRSLTLRREHHRHSVLPLGDAWDGLPASLTTAETHSWPTRLLRPLVLAEDFRVLRVSDVEVAFCPGEQKVLAFATLEDGSLLRIERAYEAAAPGALDCLARQLARAFQVSGFLHEDVLEPVALRTEDGVVVPDLEPETPGWELPMVAPVTARDPLTALLQRTWSLCEEAVHLGLDQLGSGHAARRAELSQDLREHGFRNLADQLSPWRWYSAALRTFLHLEGLSKAR